MVEGYSAEEGLGQAEYPIELGHPGAGESLASGDVRLFSALQLSSPSVPFVSKILGSHTKPTRIYGMCHFGIDVTIR